ncbi:MAG: EAL domain-containing protein [Solirubrobacterales bacterium]|nr:EAL domain-containing protein [Solirubrobacterales bacterium]
MPELADKSWCGVLERVCRERLIAPAFQPIVDLARGVVCGYEGLSRFTVDVQLGGPDEWFAAAAWHGYAGRLEAVALEAILASRPELPPNAFLSLNLSPDALRAPEVAVVLGHAEDLAGVVIEITEQAPVEDYAALEQVLGGLRARGAMVAVDDTGSGYASLRHLLALQPQFVKLDRTLITGVDHDPRRSSAVAAIGAFAGQLDAWLIAEGVETHAELDRLLELGVPLAQGYLLGRPAPDMRRLPPELAARLREHHTLRRSGVLNALARPAPTMRRTPNLLDRLTVLVDEVDRPQQVLVPRGGRRLDRHPAMCVQPHDEIRDVALRAITRHDDHRYAPLCLCDDLGRLAGVITIASLLENLARS